MESAFFEEQEGRKVRRETRADAKHSMEAESSADGAKRAKSAVPPGPGLGGGVDVDVTSIPVEAVIELVMATLGTVSMEHLRWAFDVSFLMLAELILECSTCVA